VHDEVAVGPGRAFLAAGLEPRRRGELAERFEQLDGVARRARPQRNVQSDHAANAQHRAFQSTTPSDCVLGPVDQHLAAIGGAIRGGPHPA